MNGTKFRLSCASCNATFFSPDRRARYCPKCAKKKGAVSTAGSQRPVEKPERGPAVGAGPRKPLLPLLPPKEKKPAGKRPQPKAVEASPEQREKVRQIYEERLAGNGFVWKEAVGKISDELWLNRKEVSKLLREINPALVNRHPAGVEPPPEVKAKIVELYKGYVERGERPEGGRRKTIARMLGVSFAQVRNIVYQYSRSIYQQSPTPEPTREQLFRLEKLFFAELDNPRYRWSELPERLAEQSEVLNSWQVLRWMDTLFDEEKIADVPEVAPETERQILEAYRQYLAAPRPPELGLHVTIAEQIGNVSKKQVHKVLYKYRSRRRDEYPLK